MTPLEKAMESNHVETIKLLAEATFQAKKKVKIIANYVDTL